ncbi:hypothetical protein EDD98_5615 [Streptomyces sp. PanSC19]|uniref:hypothetical protein n=1 Tax=Streptomyces sp. PanSC19 TaxID=1520455 RepID=UPI000F4760C3|nr:hypothetical protein [Streptomyces sp. PanSC19]ROQ26031.1 hypothetical protein EDD98_5615 [Streptomyces sp. PanSC19]
MTDTATIDAITLPAAASEATSAFVDAGAVLAVLPEVTPQDHHDAMAWLLLTQLAADKQHHRVDNPDRWRQSFDSTASALRLVERTKATRTVSGTGSIADLLVTEFSGASAKALSAALAAVADTGATGEGRLLVQHAQSGNKAHVLAGVVSNGADEVIIDLVSVLYPVDSTSGRSILAADVSSKQLTLTTSQLVLSSDMAQQLREAIYDKLGMLVQEKIMHVPLHG